MEILYRQPDIQNKKSALSYLGIDRCYLKHIVTDRDKPLITKKRHHHSEFEIHIVRSGGQAYEINGSETEVAAGSFLFIPPCTPHTLICSLPNTEKHAITFRVTSDTLNIPRETAVGMIPKALSDSLNLIFEEKRKKQAFVSEIIESRTLECILTILREIGAKPAPTQNQDTAPDERYLMAKQYIDDNIRTPMTVLEVAEYCHISTKQLTRIFAREEGAHTAEYIRNARCAHIEKLLSDPAKTLREISEEMGFANEYYFNTYFKKYSGMTPGAYRRTMK